MQIDLGQIYSAVDQHYANPPPLPNYQKGRCIVTSVYSAELVTGYVLMKELVRLGNTLPIEIFYREGELTQQQIDLLISLDPQRISVRKISGNAKDFITIYGTKAGWSVKIHAIHESTFNEVLWLDSDNFPIHNPEFLFSDQEYISKGSLFWRDVISVDRANRYHDQAPLWQVFRVQPNDAEPFEAGQLLIDKSRCWPQFSLVKHYADNCEYYYHFGGDTETFRMAWQHHEARRNGYHAYINYHAVSNMVPYGFMPYGPFHKGVPNQYGKWGGGTVMVQRDRDGNELFNHRNIHKMSLSNNVYNNDITNECYYHQHVKQLNQLIEAGKW